jgi:hypothetical protein
MASETFKKRQKEVARKEKQQKKFARRMERKDEKARTAGNPERADPPELAENPDKHGPSIL